MPRIRKIRPGTAEEPIFFIVDANVIANYALPSNQSVPERLKNDGKDLKRVRNCKVWWRWIEGELKRAAALVYVPDICIAEAFKVLAKKYYVEHWWNNSSGYRNAKSRLSKFVSIPHAEMRKSKRLIKVHDLPTVRDIIIGVERFYELIHKKNASVQIADLILMA